jgi:hypothetical protein
MNHAGSEERPKFLISETPKIRNRPPQKEGDEKVLLHPELPMLA